MTDDPKKVPKFTSRDFGIASFKRNEWHLTLGEQHTMQEVENSRLWGDILAKIARGDLIEAFKPDSGEWARFVVSEVGPGFIKPSRIEGFTPPVVEVAENAAMKPRWNVGKRSFDVIRAADSFVMGSGFQTKGAAVAWIDDHNKKVAA